MAGVGLRSCGTHCPSNDFSVCEHLESLSDWSTASVHRLRFHDVSLLVFH